MYLSFIVDPRYTELDLALGIAQSLQESIASELLLILIDHYSDRFQNFLDCLMKLGLVWVLTYNLFYYLIYV